MIIEYYSPEQLIAVIPVDDDAVAVYEAAVEAWHWIYQNGGGKAMLRTSPDSKPVRIMLSTLIELERAAFPQQ